MPQFMIAASTTGLPGMQPFIQVCGCGEAPSFGSILKSIKVSVLSTTLGVAGYPSGEAYKVGSNYLYTRVPRMFIRQTIGLSGETEEVEPRINQFEGSRLSNRLVVAFGKFAVTDIFDTNRYAHNPRNDFLNWALIDTGTFDYAADA